MDSYRVRQGLCCGLQALNGYVRAVCACVCDNARKKKKLGLGFVRLDLIGPRRSFQALVRRLEAVGPQQGLG